jgi:hypothetical protein
MMLLRQPRGIAKALDLGDMVGIGASSRVDDRRRDAPRTRPGLRRILARWVGAAGSQHVPPQLPMLEPILRSSAITRSRTQRKRRFRQVVKDEVGKAFRDAALPPPTP